MAKNLEETFYPATRFVKSTYGIAQGWRKNKVETIFRGIVTDILDSQNTFESSSIAPPYSIRAAIMGIDSENKDLKNNESIWIPPLLSSHTISIPEIGEEVLIIREFNHENSIKFWIGRVNDSSKLNKVLAKEYISNDVPNRIKYGFNFDVNNISISDTQTSESIRPMPIKPGDVISQGRTDTYTRHSYNSRNKRGVLELGVRQRKYDDIANRETLKNIDTKTAHLSEGLIGEVYPIETFSVKQDLVQRGPKNIIANVAQEIYNISNLENSENKAYRSVLGEKMNEFLSDLLEELKFMSDIMKDTYSLFLNHRHNVDGFEIAKQVVTWTPVGPFYQTLIIKQDDKLSDKVRQTQGTATESSQIKNLEKKFDALIKKLDKHLSKNNYLN